MDSSYQLPYVCMQCFLYFSLLKAEMFVWSKRISQSPICSPYWVINSKTELSNSVFSLYYPTEVWEISFNKPLVNLRIILCQLLTYQNNLSPVDSETNCLGKKQLHNNPYDGFKMLGTLLLLVCTEIWYCITHTFISIGFSHVIYLTWCHIYAW